MMLRGEIRLVDLEPVIGAEANKRRPAVIVSSDGANATAARLGRGVVTVVPVTSNVARVYPFQVLLRAVTTGLQMDSKAKRNKSAPLRYNTWERGSVASPPRRCSNLTKLYGYISPCEPTSRGRQIVPSTDQGRVRPIPSKCLREVLHPYRHLGDAGEKGPDQPRASTSAMVSPLCLERTGKPGITLNQTELSPCRRPSAQVGALAAVSSSNSVVWYAGIP